MKITSYKTEELSHLEVHSHPGKRCGQGDQMWSVKGHSRGPGAKFAKSLGKDLS